MPAGHGTAAFVAIVSWVLWTQALLAFRIWGPILQVKVLEVRVLDAGSKPFISQEEAESCVLPPRGPDCAGEGFTVTLCLCLPGLWEVGISLFTPWAGAAQLVSELLSEETHPCAAAHAVFMGPGDSGASRVTILDQNSLKISI